MYIKRLELYRMFFGHKELSLADYLFNSSQDEIAEIDILNDKIKTLYHTEGKFFIPSMDPSFSSVYEFAIQGIVHPDDIDIFKKLMEPSTMLQRLHDNKDTPNFMMEHFRYRLKNGQMRWVEQCILTGEENNVPNGKVLVFIRDIENQVDRDKGIINAEDNFQAEEGKDELVRLYRTDYFLQHAEAKVLKNPDDKWALVLVDIENFKLFDELYGRKEGDLLLAKIGNYIISLEDNFDCLGGYFGQDDFGILLHYDMDQINSVYEYIKSLVIKQGQSEGFNPALGIYVIEKNVDMHEAFECASLAASIAKKDIKNRIVLYDGQIRDKKKEESRILLEATRAIKNDEITFYLQPQCRISSKKIVGAESLARWIKKDGTIVPPNDYIPVLEKYGFISDLDKALWEKVFIWIRSWLDAGKKPVPISVNVSRTDIFSMDVLSYFLMLANKYKVPHNLIKIEITESSYAETTEKVGALVKELRENKFMVLMDDFGSGYSSLNLLRTIEVDAIKLDALFLNFDDEDEKGIHILESVVNMTKQISLPVIVEGVEKKEHVEFLRGLGCRYIQGFYFYKPMPISEFEKLISNEDIIDDRGLLFKHNEQFRIQEFLDKNVYSDNMLNSIIGPVAIYEWKEKNVDIVRYNEQFYKNVNVPDFSEKLEHIQNVMPFEDRDTLFSLLNEAIENKLNGSRGKLRFYTAKGTVLFFVFHFFYLGEQNGSHRFYGSATNVSDFFDLQERFDLFTNYSRDSIIFVRREEQKWKFQLTSTYLSNLLGLSNEELEKELNSDLFTERYLNKDEYTKVLKRFDYYYENNMDFNFIAKLKDKDGNLLNIDFQFKSVTNKTNNIKYILFTDVLK